MIEMLAAAGLAALVTVVTRVKKALTWPAVCAAGVLLLLITYLSSLKEAAALLGMYLAVFAVDTVFGKKTKGITEAVLGSNTGRGIRQVMANGLTGMACIWIYHATGQECFLLAYYAAIFEVMADSIASDIGVLSKKAPRDICTWKEVPKGISGGVSILGLSASGAVCIAGGLSCGMLLGASGKIVFITALAPYLGMLADSVIGSLCQVQYRCRVCGIRTELKEHCGQETEVVKGFSKISNHIVNFLCTVLAACIACLLTWYI